MTTSILDVTRILAGPDGSMSDVRSMADLRRAVGRGLPVETLSRVASYVSLNAKEATRLRDRLVPPATRKRRSGSLLPEESERVERLARVMALAERVWEDTTAARTFLHQPHPLLLGETPLEVSRTELGAREVEALLERLEYALPV